MLLMQICEGGGGGIGGLVGVYWKKDTVPADEEDDEVDTGDDPRRGHSTIGTDTIIHHNIPVLSCQDLFTIIRLSTWS